MSNEISGNVGLGGVRENSIWDDVWDKGTSALLTFGLVAMGVNVGMMAALVFVGRSFEGTAMENYLEVALFYSPTWFKAVYITAAVCAPLGLVKLGAPVVAFLWRRFELARR